MPDKRASGRPAPTRTRAHPRVRATSSQAIDSLRSGRQGAASAQRRRSAWHWPAAVRWEASTKSARCWRSPIRSMDSTSIDLDAYVGVSSGGFVAAALANGISPAQMYRLFIADGADAALKPEIFLRPAFGEFGRRLGKLPAAGAARVDAVSARPLPSRHHRIVRDTRAGGADRHLRQPRHRRLPRAPVRCTGSHQRLPAARAQTVPGRHQPGHRRVGDLRRARP